MNIQQQAFKLLLEGSLPENCTKYFSGDYPQIIDKVNIFKKKNGETPSLDFLMSYSSKLGENSEQAERISDLLYGVSKIKDSEMSIKEVCELLLDSYKDSNLRELIKKSSQALVEDNILAVERYSKDISEISRLSLGEDNFLKNDIKDDITSVSTILKFISTGIFTNYEFPSINKAPVGSILLLIGSTGSGKSLLTISANVEVYLQGKNVIYISNEMSRAQVLARIKSYVSKTPYSEIVNNNYLTDEGRIAVKAAEIVMQYNITFEKAYASLISDEEYDFSKYDIRENYFKIIAANDSDDFIRRKSKNLPIEELPNDQEILNMVREYGDTLDLISIDLLAEVAFVDKYSNKEMQMSSFGRQLKELLLLTSTNSIIVSQPENEKSSSGLRYPKYCKHLRTTSDLSVIIAKTFELEKLGYVSVSVDKCRNNKSERTYICEANYEVMNFIPTGDEMPLNEFLAEVSKENKKRGEEK